MVFYQLAQADRHNPRSHRPWESLDRLGRFSSKPERLLEPTACRARMMCKAG